MLNPASTKILVVGVAMKAALPVLPLASAQNLTVVEALPIL
jgi:hypothetical protein